MPAQAIQCIGAIAADRAAREGARRDYLESQILMDFGDTKAFRPHQPCPGGDPSAGAVSACGGAARGLALAWRCPGERGGASGKNQPTSKKLVFESGISNFDGFPWILVISRLLGLTSDG